MITDNLSIFSQRKKLLRRGKSFFLSSDCLFNNDISCSRFPVSCQLPSNFNFFRQICMFCFIIANDQKDFFLLQGHKNDGIMFPIDWTFQHHPLSSLSPKYCNLSFKYPHTHSHSLVISLSLTHALFLCLSFTHTHTHTNV